MSLLLTLLGLIIIFLGISMLLKPDGLPGMVKLYADETGLQVMASVGRILIGTALLVYADYSRLPGILTLLGWLSVISGLVFLFMPQHRFREFILLMLDKAQSFGQIAGAVVTLMGVILVYAVW
ncbi:MAG: hypothetical protein R3E95_11950 [Thiolinea sp.]